MEPGNGGAKHSTLPGYIEQFTIRCISLHYLIIIIMQTYL